MGCWNLRRLAVTLAALLLASQSRAWAEEADQDLAKKLSNPVASLISVPLQNNVDCCIGPENAAKYTLNVQPVVPITITPDVNLIVRTIMPLIYEGETRPGAGEHFGLGDFTQSFFLSPSKASGLIWAVGPVFLWPTGNPHLGTREWAAGPTFVVLRQAGPVSVGLLANHLWSYAGAAHRDPVNSTFLQPFATYTYPDSTTISVNTETTYDWEHRAWTVPINLGISHIYKFGGQRVQLQFGGRVYAVSPDGPDLGLRFTAAFLFPK